MRRIILSRINSEQKRRIASLCAVCCQAEPVRLSLPLPRIGEELPDERFFLLYDHGQLVSLIHLFYPDHFAGELIGFTHPDFRGKGYFKSLLSLAADYAEEIGLEQIYVISDGNSADADTALSRLGLESEYSEYMLRKSLHAHICPDSGTDSLSVTETSASPLAVSLFSDIFQTDKTQCEAYLEEISSDSRIHTYFLSLNGNHIGQTQLTFMDDMAYLSGFGILPEYRRQGFGGQFLHKLEALLAEQSITQLTLQVSSKNKPALSLYQKDGFQKLEKLCYFPLFEECVTF